MERPTSVRVYVYTEVDLSAPSPEPTQLQHLDGIPPISLHETLSGSPGVVDLWCFFYEPVDEPAMIAAYDALMTEDEREQHGRFVFAKDRRLFLATRALARTVLSRYAPVRPEDWRFSIGSHGKPSIASPKVEPTLHFNLSNTHGLVVCAVSVAHEEVGVDAERIDRGGETVTVADYYFSDTEVRALRALPVDAQERRFFAYWTLKESYIKARGLGLALPLHQFSFLLDSRSDVGFAVDPELGDDAASWRFSLLDASARHFVAVGAKTHGAPLSLRAASCVPLRGIVSFEDRP